MGPVRSNYFAGVALVVFEQPTKPFGVQTPLNLMADNPVLHRQLSIPQ
jgi:hypothetical protein